MKNVKSRFNVLYLLQKSKLAFLISIFLIILESTSLSLSGLKLVDTIQGIVDSDYQKAVYATVIGLLCNLLYWVFSFLNGLLTNKIQKSAMYFYRSQIAKKIRNQSSSIDQGNFISTLNNNSVQIEDALDSFFTVCNFTIWAVIHLIALFSVHYLFAIWAVIFFFLNMSVSKILKKPAEKNEQKRSKNLELYLNESSDIIRGFDVWNLYNAKKKMRDRLCEHNEKFEIERKKINDNSVLFEKITSALSALLGNSQYLFALLLISMGIVAPGVIMGVMVLSGRFLQALSLVSSEAVKISGYNHIIDEKLSGDLEADETLSDFDGFDIEVKSLEFGYTEKPVLKIPKLRFEYGKKYAIIGPSGSGKSTLSNIIMKRELDYKGEVLFGGKNLKDLNEFCLFHHMGFMTQKPYVFNDTILNNITLGESYDTSLVKEAVEESRLEDFSDKLEYALSNNGGNISGGQAQRIAIAREVIHDHEVMVFDEAVNALDQRLVREVVNILLKKKATVIFIAHNLDRDMLSEFDEVIDMSKVNECYGESV